MHKRFISAGRRRCPVPRIEQNDSSTGFMRWQEILHALRADVSLHRSRQTLQEIAPLGLAIYGNGWDLDPELTRGLLPFWRGILPREDIAALYGSAKVGWCGGPAAPQVRSPDVRGLKSEPSAS